MWNNALVVAGVVACTMTLSAQSGPASAPGQMPDAVRARCVTCHGEDLIQQQRLTRAGWERELDKMIRWGAVVPATERDLLLQYFVSNFGQGSATSAPPSSTHARSRSDLQICLACHGADIIEQQRLGHAGWNAKWTR